MNDINMNILEALKDPYLFFALLSAVNIVFYIVTLAVSHFWAKHKQYPLPKKTFSDFSTTLVILLTNILVAIPGFLLFKYDILSFTLSGNIVLETIVLLVLVDLAMYVVHRVAHVVYPFNIFHLKHHTHEKFNEFSLYVMNPIESIGLALIITGYLALYSFNLYAVIIFLVMNWFWGVVGHINAEDKEASGFFGDNTFHQIHHVEGSKNFGFYTVIWDKLFKTYEGVLR